MRLLEIIVLFIFFVNRIRKKNGKNESGQKHPLFFLNLHKQGPSLLARDGGGEALADK